MLHIEPRVRKLGAEGGGGVIVGRVKLAYSSTQASASTDHTTLYLVYHCSYMLMVAMETSMTSMSAARVCFFFFKNFDIVVFHLGVTRWSTLLPHTSGTRVRVSISPWVWSLHAFPVSLLVPLWTSGFHPQCENMLKVNGVPKFPLDMGGVWMCPAMGRCPILGCPLLQPPPMTLIRQG